MDYAGEAMSWISYGFLLAAILHLLEEFVYPGGFIAFMKKMAPPFAPFVTPTFAIVINGLFLLLCVMAALIGRSAPVFVLSIAALLGINGMTHTLGAIRARRYVPGLLTGVLLYLPLPVLAYYLYIGSGQLSVEQGVGSFILGTAYQLMPMGYLGLAYLFGRA
jgi:hypothetical protein